MPIYHCSCNSDPDSLLIWQDISIVSAVDDIQVLLDDHVIKVQTMRGSPFIKPIEEECRVGTGSHHSSDMFSQL